MQSLNDNNDDEQPGIIDSMITSVNSYVSWLFRDTIEGIIENIISSYT